MEKILLVIFGVLLVLIALHLLVTVFASYQVYIRTLVRRNKELWSRNPKYESDEQRRMYEIGDLWQSANAEYKKDVHIVNDGFNLYGEYYDFGNDKCAMILTGRMDSLRYGYFFAKPYVESGYNMLFVDARAHGESDGKYQTLGFEESKDYLVWCRLLHEQYNIKSIVFHGICIGAAGGIFALTDKDCPDYIDGIVSEGVFPRFIESMRNHINERKVNIYPVIDCIDWQFKRHTGHSMKKGPADVIADIKKPILMFQGKQDKYSLPKHAKMMYDSIIIKQKKLVYFEKGVHSMLRINNMEQYDNEIKEFLNNIR